MPQTIWLPDIRLMLSTGAIRGMGCCLCNNNLLLNNTAKKQCNNVNNKTIQQQQQQPDIRAKLVALKEWVASFPATANVKAILLQILFQTTRRPQHMIQTRVSDTRIPKPQNIAQPIRRTIQAGPMCRFVRDKTFFCMALRREICSQI